jgi:outer membrane protein assembly factor BamB
MKTRIITAIVLILSFLIFVMIIYFSLWANLLTEYSEIRNGNIPIAKETPAIFSITTKNKILSSPIVINDFLYIQTEKEVISYDLHQEKNIWSKSYSGSSKNCPMIIVNNHVLLPYQNGVILLGLNDGNEIWKYNIESDNLVIEDIELSDNFAFIATFNGWLYVLNVTDGSLVWKTQMEDRSHLDLILTGDSIIINSTSYITSYELDTGKIYWKNNADFEYLNFNKDKNQIYFVEYYNGYSIVKLVDSLSGRVINSFTIEIVNANCLLETENNFIFSGSGIAVVNNETFQTVWTNKEIDDLTCPVIQDNNLFVRKRIRDLFQFDLDTGEILKLIPLQWNLGVSSRYSIDPIKYKDGLIVVKNSKQIDFLYAKSE